MAPPIDSDAKSAAAKSSETKTAPASHEPGTKGAAAKTAPAKILKGKSWFKIVAPPLFSEKQIGEALAGDPNSLLGKRISASLLELTGDPSRYYMKLLFKVVRLDGTVAKTAYDGHESTRDFASRVVQLRTTRIDTNDVLQLGDGRLRVKCIAITNRPVTAAVEKEVRAAIRRLVADSAKDKTMEQFVESFVTGAMQQSIHSQINKIYPLRVFEVLKTEVT